jgi:hypothetical protein
MSCKLNIILDLDNTLIHSVAINQLNSIQYYWKDKGTALSMGDYVTFKRPYLEEFLDFIFKNFNVGVFTAASGDYAREIVWKFIQNVPGRKIDFLLYNLENSKKIYGQGTMKKLNYIWDYLNIYDYYPCNTILIDDNLYVKQSNYYNTLSVHPFMVFDINSEHDDVLLEIIGILNKIKQHYDENSCSYHKSNTRCQNLRLSPDITKEIIKSNTVKLGRFREVID